MAHVDQTHLLHSLVAMPPHAWSTQHQLTTSHPNAPSTTSFPSSSQSFNPSWDPSHHSPPSLPSDPLHPTDQPDHLNADTIFRDLLNLRIDTDQPPSSHVSLQSHHLAPTHHTNHHLAEHSLDHFSSHSSVVPYLQTHINPNQPHDPSLTDSVPIPLLPPFASHTPFTSASLPTRRESSHTPVFRTSIPTQHSRSANPSRSNPLASSHTGPRIKNDLYKTEICRSFAENSGFCKYGSKCQFAHGEEELRPVRRHPRYKTKLCRNFVNNGSCPYDTRCRFIHANDLPYASAPTLSALHHSPLPAPSASDSADSSCHETPDLIGDYVHNLRRLFNLTPPASATPDLSAGDPSLPLPPPFSSSVPEIETDRSSVKNSSKKPPTHHIQAEQQGAQGNPAIPDDHIYQPSASPFSKYPDGAPTQPYVPVASDISTAVTSSKARDESVDVAAETADVKKIRRSQLDFRTNQIFGPELKTTYRSNTERNKCTSTQEVAKFANEAPNPGELKVTPSKASRTRLPVFRNMTSGGDSA